MRRSNFPFLLIVALFLAPTLQAQTDSLLTREQVLGEFDRFFKAFHARDTAQLKEFSQIEVPMQTLSTSAQGATRFTSSTYGDFLISVGSIPANLAFEERIISIRTRTDGEMVHIWAEYEFYRDGTFSHRGVNSVHWVRSDGKWQIAHFIDTRRR